MRGKMTFLVEERIMPHHLHMWTTTLSQCDPVSTSLRLIRCYSGYWSHTGRSVHEVVWLLSNMAYLFLGGVKGVTLVSTCKISPFVCTVHFPGWRRHFLLSWTSWRHGRSPSITCSSQSRIESWTMHQSHRYLRVYHRPAQNAPFNQDSAHIYC